jgi:hypothetical protein
VVTFQIIDGNVSLSVVNLCRACCVWVSGRIDDFCWWRCLGFDRDRGSSGGDGGTVMKVAVAARHGNSEW